MRAPIGREVDNGGRQVLSEEYVAGEIAVDELGRCFDRTQRCNEAWQVLDASELFWWEVTPSDSVAD